MKNIFIINGHELYPAISEGRLNATLAEMAEAFFVERGCEVKTTTMQDDWNIEEEVQKHMWADFILLQTPVNWMGVAWSCKKYMDVVYTAGLDGRLCDGDGRTRKDPSKQYGSGGTLTGKKYMLSLTFNAPKAAFDDPGQFLFQGKGVDELFLPAHMNFRFFNMEPVKTFVCYDVMKNPDVSSDFTRFDAHLRDVFSELS
ncbi:NAD(P)H-dependent oxidoreductase [Desulfobaculum bizertense]|uniref:Modulator of drug activity B n=1 Tax=Desulfobaculum bizertense DSM 18034 TaxID=1121442 RepID=A0A1T4VSC7_9BACT|nr:NAD(P)H-dependent oxidoreductase [Desulfobaculum bizertense]SKA67421.1 modulator of drug activity B [Desulfobaculum bizertense DSM 18034]